MTVDKERFLKILTISNDNILNKDNTLDISFSKEIIESSLNSKKIKISFIVEQVQKELQSFDYESIVNTKGFFARLLNKKITSNDISKFLSNKQNKLISLKTDLILTQKETYKTILLMEEELNSIKEQLKKCVLLKNKLYAEAEKLKNLVLDINDLDDLIISELNQKKIDILKDFEERLNYLKTNSLVLNQNIVMLIKSIKNFKKIHSGLEDLIKITIPEWDNLFITKIIDKRKFNSDELSLIKEINHQTNIDTALHKISKLVQFS